MFHILYKKIKRDEEKSDSSKDSAALESLEKMLIQAQTVIDLLFMSNLCKLMTICSKLFQRFDVLPFEPYEAFQNLMKNLHQAIAF